MRLLVILLACCLTFTCIIATAAEAPKIDREMQLRKALRQEIDSAWSGNDFQTLETMGRDFVQHQSKTFNGLPKLAPYFFDINAQLYIDWPKEWNGSVKQQSDCNCQSPDPSHYAEADRSWDAVGQKLEAWSKLYPNSTVVPVARIMYLINRAWFYRGGETADKVNPQAWPRFQRYMAEADKIVRASAPIRLKDPAWYGYAIRIAAANDWPSPERERLYDDLAKHGQLYAVSFETAAQFMQPKWGGSYESIQDMIHKAMQDVPKQDGLEFYARLYWIMLESDDRTLRIHSLTEVNRDMLKAGFDIILARYPEPWNYIGAARTACKIGDAAYFERATRWLGNYDRFQSKPLSSIDCANADLTFTSPAVSH